jgi:hypothetical protein
MVTDGWTPQVIPFLPFPCPLFRLTRKSREGGEAGSRNWRGKDSPCPLGMSAMPRASLRKRTTPLLAHNHFSPTHRAREVAMARRHACHRLSTVTAHDSKLASPTHAPSCGRPKTLLQITSTCPTCHIHRPPYHSPSLPPP